MNIKNKDGSRSLPWELLCKDSRGQTVRYGLDKSPQIQAATKLQSAPPGAEVIGQDGVGPSGAARTKCTTPAEDNSVKAVAAP